MKTVRIGTCQRAESVIVCRKNVLSGALAPMRESFLDGGGLLFTDSNVFALYGVKIAKYLGGVPVFVMPAGEENKNEGTLFALLRAMAGASLRRNSTLIALGGGVVGDIGGLAASLYMRGISCIQVPTTLLAQVDSSVGGKTAIDFCGVKNLVGAFHQPRRVYADPVFFETLPARELRCGLGEIVKHGALCPEIFEKLWRNRERLTDPAFLAEIVPMNIAFKASVVRRDPTEKGERKSLNLGHTTAHALELGGAELSHGECVLAGLLFEGEIARRLFPADEEFLGMLASLVRKALGGVPPLPPLEQAAKLALHDKKNLSGGRVTLTLPVGLGRYELAELPIAEYVQLLNEIGEKLC